LTGRGLRAELGAQRARHHAQRQRHRVERVEGVGDLVVAGARRIALGQRLGHDRALAHRTPDAEAVQRVGPVSGTATDAPAFSTPATAPALVRVPGRRPAASGGRPPHADVAAERQRASGPSVMRVAHRAVAKSARPATTCALVCAVFGSGRMSAARWRKVSPASLL
jgi:hypothetical protein